MAGKRRFGRVRQLPSDRWQARYLGPDGKDRPAPRTFTTKTDAEIWLAGQEVEIRQGDWIDPDLGQVPFSVYASDWIRDRRLKPRTDELYRGLLKNHLLGTFGDRAVGEIREPDVRRWYKQRLTAGPTASPPFARSAVSARGRLGVRCSRASA
jgi:Phage integrase, N-terminal SAM-like domain